MAQKTRDHYVDPVLTNLSIAYSRQDFIADRIFPRIGDLSKPTGIYYKFGMEHFGPIPNTLRAPGTRAREVEWKVTKDVFSTEEYALLGKVTDEDRKAQDNQVQLEQTTVENVTELLMLDRELRVRDLVTDPTIYPTGHVQTLSGTSQWSDPDNSTPLKDVDGAKAQLASVGIVPNTMIIPQKVYNALKFNRDILDRIKYSERGLVTVDILRDLFEIENILVPASVYNTANAGQAANLVDVWGDIVWIGFVAPRPGLKTISFGYTFEYRARQVRRWREEDVKTDFFEVSEEVGEKVVAPMAGFLINDVLA